MKTEVMKYQALAGSIKSFEERKDNKGKDTFDLPDWWKSNCATLPGFEYVLKRSHTDYIELSMQSLTTCGNHTQSCI
jgi:hypothetical protein